MIHHLKIVYLRKSSSENVAYRFTEYYADRGYYADLTMWQTIGGGTGKNLFVAEPA